ADASRSESGRRETLRHSSDVVGYVEYSSQTLTGFAQLCWKCKRSPLRDTALAPGFQHLLDKVQHGWVLNAPSDLLQQLRMLDRVEITRQVDLDHGTHAPQQAAPHCGQRLVWRASGAIPVGVGAKVCLKDGFKDQLQRALHHAIANARNLQLPRFAVALWDLDPPIRLRAVGPG